VEVPSDFIENKTIQQPFKLWTHNYEWLSYFFWAPGANNHNP